MMDKAFFVDLLVVTLFFTTRTSAQQVIIVPSGEVVLSVDANSSVACHSSTANIRSVNWTVNNSVVSVGSQHFKTTFENGLATLDIINLPENYNGTTIECRAVFDSSEQSTATTTILLQGSLFAVTNFSIATKSTNSISLTWTAPFSLDIPHVDPDITYCVDVVNFTSMSTLHSQCDLIDTAFNYTMGACDDYIFTVIPVNVVGNGTSVTIHYSQTLTAPRASEQQLKPLSSMDGVYTYQLTLSSLVCESELTFEDVDTGEETRLGGSDLIISNNTIMFTTAQLNTNRLYSVSVSASNPNGSAPSNTRISTHDIFTTSVEATEGSSVAITTSYFVSSTASGVLYTFLLSMDSRSFNYERSVYITLSKSASLDTVFPYNLQSGQYLIFAYDIESDGVLRDGVAYPASNNSLTLINDLEGSETLPRSSINCSITISIDEVAARCNYSSGVTGFQMIVQNNALVHKLHINQTTNGGHLATVQVEKDGLYRVTIFPIYGDNGIVGSNDVVKLTITKDTGAGTTAAPVLVLVLLGLAVLGGIVLLIVLLPRIKSWWTSRKMKAEKMKDNRSEMTQQPLQEDQTETTDEEGDARNTEHVNVDSPTTVTKEKLKFEQYRPAKTGVSWRDIKYIKFTFGTVVPVVPDTSRESTVGAYSMNCQPHGLALIINNEMFGEKLGNREGTAIDEENLIKVFGYLGYDIDVYRDCTSKKIIEIMEGVRSQDHTNFDSFVCCILSHGKSDCVYGVDGRKVSLQDVTDSLRGDKCPSLANKPKLFFLQVDKTKKSTTGVTASGLDKVAIDDLKIPRDFFICYALSLGHVSLGPDNGSCYITELCECLAVNAGCRSLNDIMTIVNKRKCQCSSKLELMQSTDVVSRLVGGNVFFFD